MPRDDQDITHSLARAFDRAWDGYYRAGRMTLSQDVARTELARRLVQLSKEGVRDEESLAKAGLKHLRQVPQGTLLNSEWPVLPSACCPLASPNSAGAGLCSSVLNQKFVAF
jgi:hypothetical protein